MNEEEKNKLDVLVGVIKKRLGEDRTSIENLTSFFDNTFTDLNAKNLPEYQKAIDAVCTYQEAFAKHFTNKYSESISQKTPQT